MKRLFVTGASGFVGRRVLQVAADLETGRNFTVCAPPASFDILDPVQVDAQLGKTRPDAILHLAAQSSVGQSFRDPEGTFRVNAIGTLRLFEGMKREGIAPHVLLVSSGDVYGQVQESQMPISEAQIPRPRSPYAVSKLAAEALTYQWHVTERVPAIVARPFNHVGPGQSDAFVLPAFARQIAEIKAGRRDPVIDVGDIDTTRDFTHVADIAEAYLLLLERGESGEIYNICSGSDLRVRDLLERMLVLSGVNAEIRRDPSRYRPAEQRVMRGDNAKIRSLGWAPRRSIDDSLKEILADWERRISDG